jgi:hypothetical protein
LKNYPWKVSELILLLSSPYESIRFCAAYILRGFPERNVLPIIVKHIFDSSLAVRYVIAFTMQKLGFLKKEEFIHSFFIRRKKKKHHHESLYTSLYENSETLAIYLLQEQEDVSLYLIKILKEKLKNPSYNFLNFLNYLFDKNTLSMNMERALLEYVGNLMDIKKEKILLSYFENKKKPAPLREKALTYIQDSKSVDIDFVLQDILSEKDLKKEIKESIKKIIAKRSGKQQIKIAFFLILFFIILIITFYFLKNLFYNRN